jgi:hypothetical protein
MICRLFGARAPVERSCLAARRPVKVKAGDQAWTCLRRNFLAVASKAMTAIGQSAIAAALSTMSIRA